MNTSTPCSVGNGKNELPNVDYLAIIRDAGSARDCSGSSRAAGGYTEGGWAERPEEAPEQPSRSAACRTGLLAEGPRAAK